MKKTIVISVILMLSLSLAAQVRRDTITKGKSNQNVSFTITTTPPDNWMKKEVDTTNILKSINKPGKGLKNSGGGNPLIFIDGVKCKNGLSSIDPNDVESINVLKGEKAIAAYGRKAKDGVIVVTMKKR